MRLSIIAALQPNRVPVARSLLRQIGGLLSITEGIDSFGAHRLQVELLALRGVGRGDYGRRGLAPCQIVPARALRDYIGFLRVGLVLSVCQIDVYRLLQILQGTFIVGYHSFSGGNGSIEGIVGSPREHEDAHAKCRRGNTVANALGFCQQLFEVVLRISLVSRHILLQCPAVTLVGTVLIAIDCRAGGVIIRSQYRAASHVAQLDVGVVVVDSEDGVR